jgi:zinc transporter ZupT
MALTGQTAALVAAYGLIPAFCMFMGSMISSFMVIPPPKIVSALQHLAGGIILSAIAIEFVPVLVGSNTDPWEIPVLIASFLGGAGMLIVLGEFMDEAEGGDEEEGKEKELVEVPSQQAIPAKKSIFDRSSDYLTLDDAGNPKKRRVTRKSMITKAYENVAMTEEQKQSLAPVARTTIAHQEQVLPIARKAVYPLTLAVAVALDAFLDGTFIGIGFAAANNVYGGFVLALSLSIEMTFLGLTFAVAIPRESSFTVKMASILMGPIILVVATFFGAGVGLSLKAWTVPFQALTAFGASALLFTVGEELLVSAHDEEEEHEWWIDFMTIAGFLITILIDKGITLLGA